MKSTVNLYRACVAEIKMLVDRMEEIRSMAERCTSQIDSGGGIRGKGRHSDKVADGAITLVEYAEQIKLKSQELMELKQVIEDWIATIPDPITKAIAEGVYLNGMTHEAVAKLLEISETTTRNRLRPYETRLYGVMVKR